MTVSITQPVQRAAAVDRYQFNAICQHTGCKNRFFPVSLNSKHRTTTKKALLLPLFYYANQLYNQPTTTMADDRSRSRSRSRSPDRGDDKPDDNAPPPAEDKKEEAATNNAGDNKDSNGDSAPADNGGDGGGGGKLYVGNLDYCKFTISLYFI